MRRFKRKNKKINEFDKNLTRMKVIYWIESLIFVKFHNERNVGVLKSDLKGIDFWKLEFKSGFGIELDSLLVSSNNVESHFGIRFLFV
jgi:hypothetical protein